MGFCGKCLKIINGTLTGSFLIVGLAQLAFGLFATYTLLLTLSTEIISVELVALPSLCFVAFGIALICMVFLGFCAVCRESPACIETYSIVLIILALAQIGIGIYCVLVYSSMEELGMLKMKISNYVDDLLKDPIQMNDFQKSVHCCGASGPGDYTNMNNNDLPRSCCGGNEYSCTIGSENLYRQGCADQMYEYTVVVNWIIGWVSLIIGASELIAAALGICLSCSVWRKRSYSWN